MSNVKVLIPLAGGFEEIEAVNLIDVLRRAEIDVLVASLDNESLIKGAHGLVVQTDSKVQNINSDEIDMIVLPGGWVGTKALAQDANVQRILKEMDAKSKHIGAICAAPYALNEAGVLKHSYTCYPSVENDIRTDGFLGDKAMVVEDENVMTSRGPATAICFALKIVKRLKGEDMYLKVRAGLLAEYCDCTSLQV
jgi:protein deglycase